MLDNDMETALADAFRRESGGASLFDDDKLLDAMADAIREYVSGVEQKLNERIDALEKAVRK